MDSKETARDHLEKAARALGVDKEAFRTNMDAVETLIAPHRHGGFPVDVEWARLHAAHGVLRDAERRLRKADVAVWSD